LKSQLSGQLCQEIKTYFQQSRKSNEPPRVGVYTVTGNGKLANLSMCSGGAISEDKELSDYTCFIEAKRRGTPYLDNNIPKTVKKNKSYIHAGFNLKNIKDNYKQPFRDNKIISVWKRNRGQEENDFEWSEMASMQKDTADSLY